MPSTEGQSLLWSFCWYTPGALDLLAHLGTPGSPSAAVDLHPQSLSCPLAFQPLSPQFWGYCGQSRGTQQFALLTLIKLASSVQVPLQNLPALQQINTPAQLGVIHKFTESALDPLIQIISKDIKQDWGQKSALGTPPGYYWTHHEESTVHYQRLRSGVGVSASEVEAVSIYHFPQI